MFNWKRKKSGKKAGNYPKNKNLKEIYHFVIASQHVYIKVGSLLPLRKPVKLCTCHGDYLRKICVINGWILACNATF